MPENEHNSVIECQPNFRNWPGDGDDPMVSIRPKASTAMLVVLAMAPAIAVSREPSGKPRAATFQALVDCRAIADDKLRLACFDKAVAVLDAAEASRDVVVVDKAQIREGRRQLFGLSLPNFTLFKDTPRTEELKEVDSVATAVRFTSEGQWLITLEDGAVWQQTQPQALAKRPRIGSKIHIEAGTLGSFFLRIDGETGQRARRVQ